MIHQPILPQSRTMYGLKIVPSAITTTGGFLSGSAMKLVWHTTEGGDFHAMCQVLRAKGDEPHFVLDPVGFRVAQMIGLNQYAKALEHPPGTPETNRAGCIQVEVCGFAAQAPRWGEGTFSALAALALLIEHRTGVRRIADLPFDATPSHAHRVDPRNWLGAHGHFGHEHAPSQPSGHWDPGTLNIDRVFSHMRALDV